MIDSSNNNNYYIMIMIMIMITITIIIKKTGSKSKVPAPVVTLRNLTMVQMPIANIFSSNGQMQGAKFIGICKRASCYFVFPIGIEVVQQYFSN